MHGKNQPVGFVLVVIGGNVDNVLAGKTGAHHRVRVDAGFEIHSLISFADLASGVNTPWHTFRQPGIFAAKFLTNIEPKNHL
jgi:hypothetical protein